MQAPGALDSKAVLLPADPAGELVTPRRLEYWRSRRLIPRPRRSETGSGRWVYPPGTDRQLVRLLHWRARTRSLELVRIALWVEGFPVEADDVRAALAGFAAAWTTALAREFPLNVSSEAASTIDAVAADLAARRGRAVVPRVVRMSAPDRRRAYGYMVALMLGLDYELESRKDDVILLERMLGLRSGRGAGLAAKVPIDKQLQRFARPPSSHDVERAIADAGETEFEYVRRAVQVIVSWMSAALPLLLAEEGAKGQPFATLASELCGDVVPDLHASLVCCFLVSLSNKRLTEVELRSHFDALSPGALDVELLKQLPPGHRAQAYQSLPDERRRGVQRQLQRPRGLSEI